MEALFGKLDDFIQESEYEEALGICETILGQSTADKDAQKCKGLCLLHLGQYEECLDWFSKHSPDEHYFERAYCHYKLKQYKEALKVVDSEKAESNRILKLKAQVLYSLEDFEGCVKIYSNIVKEKDQDSVELITNMCAALILAGERNEKYFAQCFEFIKEHSTVMDTMFEFAYNVGCAYAADGHYNDACKYLQIAQTTCKHKLAEEDATEEEIEEELATISTQLAYVYQMQARTKEALEIYNGVVKSENADAAVKAVAANNVVSLKSNQREIADSEKFWKEQAFSAHKADKLVGTQKKIIAVNRCMLLLYTNKAKQCRELLQELKTQYPNDPILVLIESAMYFRANKVATSEKILSHFLDTYTRTDGYAIYLRLSLAQLHLTKGDIDSVLKILGSLDKIRHRPGMVSLLVALYDEQNDLERAKKVFQESEEWWVKEKKAGKKNPGPDTDKYVTILKGDGSFHMAHGLYAEAARAYKVILGIYPKDPVALPQLVFAYAEFDPNQAEKVSSRLPKIRVDSSIDVEALGDAPLISLSQIRRSKDDQAATPVLTKKKRKRKKKKRLPKDLTKPADPERWLPMRERSYYKARRNRRNRNRNPLRGAQGASPSAVKEEASRDQQKRQSEDNRNKRDLNARAASRNARTQGTGRRQKQQRRRKKN
eukprot:TRINITY_DN13189_c0_g1_i1.p1 TRINITY_DN13189_c0_g1~~TRINITY_DN13189_c0_g1_i1.p1  ORF type:complete len:659 (+),score=150.99 TRINITY_DN13189_c0_g1_i1:53-2029(+)